MSNKRHFIFAHDVARKQAAAWCLLAPEGYHCRIEPPTRSLEQNARMWAMLKDISEQVIWYGRKLDSEAWKHIFSSSLRKLDVVPNLDGTGFVALGAETSKMTKSELSDLMMLIETFGIERNIKFKD